MSARLVEIHLPETEIVLLEQILPRHTRSFWRVSIPGVEERYSCIVQQRYSERLLDELEAAFSGVARFRVYVLATEAVLPPLHENAETAIPEDAAARQPTAIERFFTRDRISTDELYDDIEENLHARPSYLVTAFLSAIIAGLGMRSGQTAVVIGAMIIAPLLGPTIGLQLTFPAGPTKKGAAIAGSALLYRLSERRLTLPFRLPAHR